MGLLIAGVVLCFLGACNAIGALGDQNATRAVGGGVIALVFFVAGVPSLAMGLKRVLARSGYGAVRMKKCPFCAEMIKAEATVCRYCGRDLG